MAALKKNNQKNPAISISLIALVWVLVSCLFFKSTATPALGIPLVTWLFAIGGIVCMVLGLFSLIWMKGK